MSDYKHSPFLSDGVDDVAEWKPGINYDKGTNFYFIPSELGCIPFGSDVILKTNGRYIGTYVDAGGLDVATTSGSVINKVEIAKVRIFGMVQRVRDKGYYELNLDLGKVDPLYLKEGDYAHVTNVRWVWSANSVKPSSTNTIVPDSNPTSGRWHESLSTPGLRRDSVDDKTALKALSAVHFELRETLDTGDTWAFKITSRLTAKEIANVKNISDDADTGKWVLQPRGVIVDFDYDLGSVGFATPDNDKAIYALNGQTVVDAKLAAFLVANPKVGFTVTGNNVYLPDHRGRYLGASGSKGLSSSDGYTYTSSNKSHTHKVYTGDGTVQYGHTGTTAMRDGDNNWQWSRYWLNANPLSNSGGAYARPESLCWTLCITGGRSIMLEIDPDKILVENKAFAKNDMLLYDDAKSLWVPTKYEYNLRVPRPANIGALKLVKALDYMETSLKDTGKKYIFTTSPIASETADTDNEADAAATGLWVLQKPNPFKQPVVRYSADGALKDYDHIAILGTGCSAMTLSSSEVDRTVEIYKTITTDVTVDVSSEKIYTATGVIADGVININQTNRQSKLIYNGSGAGWMSLV